MDTKELEKIQMRNDGHDGNRFQSLLKTVVTVPKKDIKEQEAREQAEKKVKEKE